MKAITLPELGRSSGIWLAASFALVLASRGVVPERSLVDVGPRSLLDAAFALIVTGMLVFLALSLGETMLTVFRLGSLPSLDRTCLSFGLGMGALAYAVFGLGLASSLTPAAIAGGCVGLMLLLHRGIDRWLRVAASYLRRAPAEFGQLPLPERAVAGLVIWIAAAVILLALAPPSVYDALMYHLEGPARFLRQGAFYPSTERWWMNMPFTIESLYLIPMAFGSDTAPRLLHALWAAVLVGTTFAMARQSADSSAALWAIAILLGMPMLSIWASDANIDFGWAAYETLSVAAILAGVASGRRGWLALGGVFIGLALGSKYMAVSGTASLVILLALLNRKKGWRQTALSLLAFVVPAAIVALPWYGKNWLWLGDPFFPFLTGGARFDPIRMRTFYAYAATFQPARDLNGWLSLPTRLFLEPESFADVFPPSPLVLGALLYPLVARPRRHGGVAFLILIKCFLWSVGPALNIRYLLPTFPLVCILSAYSAGATGLPGRWHRPLRSFSLAMAIGLLLSSALILTGILFRDHVWAVVSGQESKASNLLRVVPTYSAVAFAQSHLPPGARILTTGDGRAYYCGQWCYDTDDQFLWMNLVIAAHSPSEFGDMLAAREVTHLLWSFGDTAFLEKHDPNGGVQRALLRLEDEFLPACGHKLYEDPQAALYRIEC